MPFYLATREFFRLCRQRLAPGGIVALNVSTVPGDHRLAEGIAGTLRTEFPQVVTWQALRFNQFVVGLTAPLSRAAMTARLASAPHDLLPDTRLFARDLREAAPAADAVDRRPLPGRVGHRPHDRRLRHPRQGDRRGPPPHGPARRR